jgi:hypothetical protein
VANIHLGFQLGTGEPVSIPLHHLVITGQTQAAGKTTALEGLVSRAAVKDHRARALAFVTKRGEGAFTQARRIGPYFRDQGGWEYVASILEASRGEKMRFERAWIIRASAGATTLQAVQANVKKLMAGSKGMSADVYLTLDAYLDVVVPQIAKVDWARTVDLQPGLSVMDLTGMPVELQHLVIESTLGWVHEREHDTIVLMPEAWKFIPEGRKTPVRRAAEFYIRQGAGLGNYLWIDTQDIAGVWKLILKSVPVWILGVQREWNEIKRTVAEIPEGVAKPKPGEIAALGLGEFFACWGTTVVRVYAQPAWMPPQRARTHAIGSLVAIPGRPEVADAVMPQEDPRMCQEHERLAKELELVSRALNTEKTRHAETHARAEEGAQRAYAADQLAEAITKFLGGTMGGGIAIDEEAIVRRVLARIPAGGTVVQVTPPEKLRRDFQTAEVARLLAEIGAMTKLEKSVLRLLESTDEYVGQQTVALRLGRATGGGSWVDLGKAVKGLAERRYLELKDRTGVRKNLHARITEDLAFYKAMPAEIDQTYQAVLHALATEP